MIDQLVRLLKAANLITPAQEQEMRAEWAEMQAEVQTERQARRQEARASRPLRGNQPNP